VFDAFLLEKIILEPL